MAAGRLQITETADSLQIVLPLKKHYFMLLISGVLTIFLPFGILAGLAALTSGEEPIGSLLMAIPMLCGLEYLAFIKFMWHVKGREVMTVEQGSLQIEQITGKRIISRTVLPAAAIGTMRIREATLQDKFLIVSNADLLAPWLYHNGWLEFSSGPRVINWGIRLQQEEADEVLRKLEKYNPAK